MIKKVILAFYWLLLIVSTVLAQEASQTEDFPMWGMCGQRVSLTGRLINIILGFMSIYLLACSIERFLLLKRLRKEFYNQLKTVWKSYF